MNKEAIERTKARVKKSIKNRNRVIVAPGFYIDRIRVMNPNHSPVVYYVPQPNIWEPLTPRQYLFVCLVSLSIVALVIWWAK